MRILVCGSRHWNNYELIRSKLLAIVEVRNQEIPPTIIEGGAPGADSMAGYVARAYSWPLVIFPAQWDKYARAAGPIRNQQMLTEGKPDFVLVFHNDIANSKGTKDMVNRARKENIPVEVIAE